MLRCKEIPALSEDYLDGKLPFKAKASVMLHLMICKNCRRYLKYLHLTSEVIRENEPEVERPVEESKVDKLMYLISAEAKGIPDPKR